MLRDLSGKYNNYTFADLSKKNVDKDPFKQFVKWLDLAITAELNEPNAMVLSTVGDQGKPSSRVVLLKEVNENGFVFFTNYLSRKGLQLAVNPYASLVFFWAQFERQVRIEGIVEKLPAQISDDYFKKRPIDSQMSAIISPQSSPIPNREFLLEKKAELEERIKKEDIKRPDFWGGYLLKPGLFEFWQGRPNRLNDRIQYTLSQKKWEIARLAP